MLKLFKSYIKFSKLKSFTISIKRPSLLNRPGHYILALIFLDLKSKNYNSPSVTKMF